MLKKAIIANTLHIPITQCETLSADTLDKYYDASTWIIENITLAPFLNTKEALKK